MKFNLHTYDIQRIVIALICYHPMDNDPLTEDDCHRLSELFCDINNLCTEENGYTVSLDICDTLEKR